MTDFALTSIVLSAGIERTGALSFLARRMLAHVGHSESPLTAAIVFVIGGLSAFINNTAAVAIFIPVVLEVCRRSGASPGRILMPMSHAATFGGMCTLIGTSTNPCRERANSLSRCSHWWPWSPWFRSA
jgi:Na+/H+ antiporter NhaD/arsenite permease-like protein